MKRYIVFVCMLSLCASCRGPETARQVDIRDSLEVREGLGPVVVRTYADPAVSGNAADSGYVLTLYNQEYVGGGVFRLARTPAGAEDLVSGGSESFGTWNVLRGDAADINATVYQLLPYGKEELPVNLLYSGDSLVMLDAAFERPSPTPVLVLRSGE